MAVAEIPTELPDYDRDDWNHWTDSDDDCQDARQEVLVAESRRAVSYRTYRGCRVAAGQWLAPYTNTVVIDPSKLDVDHMVPLGNAHDSGAWRWSTERRRAVCQLPRRPPAPDCRYGQRQPFEGCSGTRGLETRRPVVLVPVRRRLGHDQGHLGPNGHRYGVHGSARHAHHLRCPASTGGCGQHGETRSAIVRRKHSAPQSHSQRQLSCFPVRFLRRRAGGRRNPRTGKPRRRQGLPEIDGTQREGWRWRRGGLRTIGPTRSQQTGSSRTKRPTNRERLLAARYLIVLTFSATMGLQHAIFGRGTSDD